jgi:hypothetical protein
LEFKKLEELYSFKTMIRMLYEAGIMILRQREGAGMIPYLSFPSSRIEFTGSLSRLKK